MTYYEGGYMTAWTDCRYLKPNNQEKVIIYWDGLIDVAYYKMCGNQFETCDDCFTINARDVDFWMRIPPVPMG